MIRHDEVSVVISFFSAADYELPRRHLHSVIHMLNAQEVPLVVTQAVFPGQEAQPVPESVVSKNYETSSLLFHKERLWNLGAQLTNSRKIIFLDGDVIYKDSNWLRRCCRSLDKHDIIQPFSMAIWLDERGYPDMHREPMSSAIASEETPRLQTYHPGFGWGMTRDAFDRSNGFFDYSVAGNSDALFGLSLRYSDGHEEVEQWYARRQDPSVNCRSYRDYKQNIYKQNFSVGTPSDVEVVHLWHGSRSNRQYITRGRLFPRKEDGEYAVHTAPNGLQVWDNEEEANKTTQQYFKDKRDDG